MVRGGRKEKERGREGEKRRERKKKELKEDEGLILKNRRKK